MKRVLISCALLLIVVAWVASDIAAGAVEETRNPVTRSTPYRATPLGAGLHQRLVIADLHADSLLWNRDLLSSDREGHGLQ